MSKTLTGLSIVSLSLARHLERSGVIPEGSCAEELERRLIRLPPSLAGTSTEEVLRLSISWLRKDLESSGETSFFVQ